jgi:aryl-phospho-beta-D-glucosidase BglC (GH1 family)
MIKSILGAVAGCLLGAAAFATPVADNGKLRVEGVQLVNEEGNPVQLRGMSSHGLHWDVGYNSVSKESLTALRDEWGADIFRAAMYVGEGGYASNPGVKERVYDIIKWTGELGIYCLIDWHVHDPGDPNSSVYSGAADFFDEISKHCKDMKHVLYEICNEPNAKYGEDDSWANIKTYANKIIPVIRKNDPNSVVIVGTPNWSQLNVWNTSIVNDQLKFGNIMYAFHFYSGSHADLQADFKIRICQIPVFVTEWGTSEASGAGGNYLDEAAGWLKILDGDNTCGVEISWCNWSFTDKDESSAALKPGAASQKNWTNTSVSGTWVRQQMLTPDKWIPIGSDPSLPPQLSSISASESKVQLSFSKDIATVSSAAGFTVSVNGTAAAISSVSQPAADKLQLLLSAPIKAGDAVVVNYSGTSLQGTSGQQLANFARVATNTMQAAATVEMIDDCEDGDETHSLGGYWYTFNDNDAPNNGASTVSPAPDATFAMASGGASGSLRSATITYNLNKGSYQHDPFAGMGIVLKADETDYDASAYTGITFMHKGQSFIVEVVLSSVTNHQHFQLAVPASADWAEQAIKWADLRQPDWGAGGVAATWDAKKINKIQFKIQGNTGNNGTLALDNLAFTAVAAATNKQPVYSGGLADLILAEGFGTKTVNLSAAFTDADGDALSFTVSSSNTGAVSLSVAAGVLTITEVGAGVSVITIIAQDGKGGTANTSFAANVGGAEPADPTPHNEALAASVSPVPFADVLYISPKGAKSLQLYSACGLLVYQLQMPGIIADMSAAPQGTYILKLLFADGSELVQLVSKQ